ncbi:M1 family metallopeptidase [Geothrix sp. 21YS21S-4]|uniref:M1 family metallopeptidase n=1 Tax=Geothrix sp. 21YS21S-4 TaxID=3068889 RepID=UPI0027BA43B3|nr:M1 family aminopeptidase [Geothrix sp. 21YS21S-4]
MAAPFTLRFRAMACLFLMFGAAVRAQVPSDPFESVEALRLGPSRTGSQEVSFTVGKSRIQFSGRWAPLRRGEQDAGLFLEGNGRFSYTSTFEPEWPLVEQSVKELTKLPPTKESSARVVNIPFTRARILLAGFALPAWEGQFAEENPAGYAAFADRWQKVDGYFPGHLLASQTLNAPNRAVAVIELEGNGRHWLYRYDDVEAMEETLAAVRPLQSANPDLKDWHYLAPLSGQYLRWDPRKDAPPAHFRINALDVDLRTEDNRQATLVSRQTLMPLEGGLRLFTFDFWSSIAEPKTTRHIRIRSVTDGAGKPLPFSHSHDLFAVCLPQPATRGVPFTLQVEYEGDFLIQPGGSNYWQLGVKEGWYPTSKGFNGEWYTFHGTVRTRGDWLAFMPGGTVRREKDGDWNLVETRTEQPICFATILGGKYYLDEDVRDGLTVRIATYGFKPGPVNKVFKEQTRNVIRYYETFLGPFPFKEFLIVEKNEWGYGQAPAGMMYITRDAFEQAQTIRQMQELADAYGTYAQRNISIRTMDVRHVLAHEIAHQYWGIMVKMPSPQDQWITEAFADYCAALYDRDTKGKNRFAQVVAIWKAQAKQSQSKGPIPLANDIRFEDPRETWIARRDLLYGKGPLLLHALHQELGDDVFLTWLKSSQTNFRWKFVTTPRLFDLLGFITKKDYKAFLNDYFWGLGLPPEKP